MRYSTVPAINLEAHVARNRELIQALPSPRELVDLEPHRLRYDYVTMDRQLPITTAEAEDARPVRYRASALPPTGGQPHNTMIQTTSYVDGLVDFMLIESEDTPEFAFAEAMYQQIGLLERAFEQLPAYER